jgi:hypothetical protein
MSYRARALAVTAAVASLLAVPASASAAFSIEKPKGEPIDTKQANTSTRFNLHLEFGGNEHVKDQTTRLPLGIQPSTDLPTCPEPTFDDPNQMCPANTQVAKTTVGLTAFIGGALPVDESVPGKVFQLTPVGGFPKLGILLEPEPPAEPARQKAEIRVHPELNVLENTVRNFPQTAHIGGMEVPIRINSIDITLNRDFIKNPATCTVARTTYLANSYESPGTTVSNSATYTPTGCAPPPTAKCAGKKVTKAGTGRRETINGTPRRDVINGRGGNDVIRGRGGNDILCGAAGKDRLIGGPGKDRLFGQAGKDTLVGGPGKDVERQ